MNLKTKEAILLFKEYCSVFKLRPTTDSVLLEKWTAARGPMLAGTFVNGDDTTPPVAWITPDGELFIEQDEDLLEPNEPAVAALEESVIRVAINNKQPIHPVNP